MEFPNLGEHCEESTCNKLGSVTIVTLWYTFKFEFKV